MAEEPRTFWAKLAVISGFLTALAGVMTVMSRCAETQPPAAPSYSAPQAAPSSPAPQAAPTYSPPQAAPSAYPAQPASPAYSPSVFPASQAAYFCCDLAGMRRCQLVAPTIAGGPCFCPGQGSGVSCP